MQVTKPALSLFITIPIEILNIILTACLDSYPEFIKTLRLVCKLSEAHDVLFFKFYFRETVRFDYMGKLLLSAFAKNQHVVIHTIIEHAIIQLNGKQTLFNKLANKISNQLITKTLFDLDTEKDYNRTLLREAIFKSAITISRLDILKSMCPKAPSPLGELLCYFATNYGFRCYRDDIVMLASKGDFDTIKYIFDHSIIYREIIMENDQVMTNAAYSGCDDLIDWLLEKKYYI